MFECKRHNQENFVNNYDLFAYIKCDDNNMLSKMKGIDLQELLFHINNYYMELRDSLVFDNSITFGLKLELERVKLRLKNKLNQASLYNIWTICEDSSLSREIEINSDYPSTWFGLDKICSILNNNKYSFLNFY